jgi:uncharacterized integral membrane protein
MQSIMRLLIGVVAAAVAIGLVIFGVQNTQAVQIQFLNFSTERISVSLLVIGAVILGAGLMWLIGLYGAAQRGIRQMRDARERSSLATRNKELEQRIASLEKELGTYRPAQQADGKSAGKPVAK